MNNKGKPSPCPVCAATQSRVYFAKDDWVFARCSSCTHRFGSAPRDAEEGLIELYTDDYAGFREDPVFRATVGAELDSKFKSRLPAGARILDVGCGSGDFLTVAVDRGFDATGMDVSTAAAERCRTRGLNAVAGDFLTLGFDRKFDAITMWDVVEHLPDPVAFMRRSLELLEPGGYLVMKTPYVADATFKLVARVRRMAGPLLQVPSHIQFFTDQSMSEAGAAAGFEKTETMRLGHVRQRAPVKSARKAVARVIRTTIDSAHRNGNLYVWMRAPS